MNTTDKDTLCGCDIIHEEAVKSAKEKMLQANEYLDFAQLFKIFGDGTRVQILHALENEELCVCDLAVLLGLTKSAVSHQLKTLRLANLVKYRRVGQICFYSLADDHVKKILDMGFEHIKE